ncbi:unnamed protein product [Mytilus coruscus]|uniref:Uncharacterized protein n=1 Tax=Mytilus coruscus TaxID=42192 RepID=A0A6J8B1J0_MYTCO|nr:unnamed protein product [Mytilus coruscus]
MDPVDEDASKVLVLQSALAGDVDRKIKAMSTIIYAKGKYRFGIEEQKKGKSQAMKENRRVSEIAKLRREQRNLTKCYKKAEGKNTNAEESRELKKEPKERARKRSQLTANPFGFIKKLLGDKRSGRLDCPKEEVEHYLRDTHSDPDRERDLIDQHRLISLDEPTLEFDMSEPKLHEVMSTLKKARAASAPGPNVFHTEFIRTVQTSQNNYGDLSK